MCVDKLCYVKMMLNKKKKQQHKNNKRITYNSEYGLRRTVNV